MKEFFEAISDSCSDNRKSKIQNRKLAGALRYRCHIRAVCGLRPRRSSRRKSLG